jgi:hypothetical protein
MDVPRLWFIFGFFLIALLLLGWAVLSLTLKEIKEDIANLTRAAIGTGSGESSYARGVRDGHNNYESVLNAVGATNREE